MMTIEEHRQYYSGKSKEEAFKGQERPALWYDVRDLMAHMLKFSDETIFDDGNNASLHVTSPSRIDDIREHLDSGKDDYEEFDDIMENAYQARRVWREVQSDDGDLDIDAYINDDDLKFRRHVPVVVEDKTAISVFVNMWVAHVNRGRKDVEEAYKECYKIAAQCEADQKPCRVIGVISATLPDFYNHKKPLTQFVVLKDYSDPIFPAIWAGLKNNRICNSVMCAIFLHVMGTSHTGAGLQLTHAISMRDYVDDHEEIITFGNIIKP